MRDRHLKFHEDRDNLAEVAQMFHPARRRRLRVIRVVTVAAVPVYSTIASSEAHADPVATTATVLKGGSCGHR